MKNLSRHSVAKTEGFTILELMFVVIIIAVLVAVGVPSYLRVTERAKAAEVTPIMNKIKDAQMQRKLLSSAASFTLDFKAANPNFPTIVDNQSITTTTAGNTNDTLRTTNFDYVLLDNSVKAVRRARYTYTITMDSYDSGKMCCDGADCAVIDTVFNLCSI